ncbi:MAG: hypothetical protein P8181_01740 [bacterium]
MGDTRKPRHIRDIAHLYISGSNGPVSPPSATVLIAADGRSSVPGFHAANLAAAFAAKGLHVNLFERSGVLPNAGYFLSMPAARYLPWMVTGTALESGIGGVNIDCSAGACVQPDGSGDRPRIDLLHLPLVYPVGAFRAALRMARVFADDVTVFLLLRTKETPLDKFARIVEDELGPLTAGALDLREIRDQRADDAGDREDAFNLGSVTGWTTGLGDRVPAVVRDAESPLSIEIASVAETMLFKINKITQSRRNARDARTSGWSDGLRSG